MVAVCGTNLVILGNSFCPFCPLAPAEKKQPNDPQMTALPFNLQPVLSRWRWSLGLPSPRAAGEAGKNILEAVFLSGVWILPAIPAGLEEILWNHLLHTLLCIGVNAAHRLCSAASPCPVRRAVLPPSFAGAPLRQPFAHQATQRVQHRGTDRKRCCGVVVGFHQQGCLLKQFSLCRGFTHFIPLRASRPTGAGLGLTRRF